VILAANASEKGSVPPGRQQSLSTRAIFTECTVVTTLISVIN